jgi:hypothetical protein
MQEYRVTIYDGSMQLAVLTVQSKSRILAVSDAMSMSLGKTWQNRITSVYVADV